MKVRDAMTKFPATCTPDTTLAAVAHLMIGGDCGAIPVISEVDTFPIGIITDRDIAIRAMAMGQGPNTLVRRCMTTPVVTVNEDAELEDCIDLLEARKIRRLVVVDRSGRCSGMLSQGDIAAHAPKRRVGELLQHLSAHAR